MDYAGTADIDAMLADLAAINGTVQVTVGGITVTGVKDEIDQEMLEGHGAPFTGTRRAVTVRTDVLPALAHGVAIVIDGSEYAVQDHMKLGDGALTQILCTAPISTGMLKALLNAVTTLLPPALREVTIESSVFDAQGYEGTLLAVLTSGARTTAFGGLTVTVLDCDTPDGEFEEIGAFESVSDASSVQVLSFIVSAIGRYLKVMGTINVPIGQEAAFPYAVRLVGLKP